ncbi:MAG: hypothetical protein PHY02_06300 [Phycisphaerae bacterium]|nr:hypothetical protein [Phycisphaerae bacterium]
MTEQYTIADALGLFLTGATSDGGSQPDPNLSLGNFRSSIREDQIGFFLNRSIPGIIIERISGANGGGLGLLETAGGGSCRWTAPDDTPGVAVTIADGETKMLQSGGDAAKYIVISRNTTASLIGSATVNMVSVFNNAVGFANVPSGEAASRLRCIAFKNVNAADGITNLKVWLGTLGTQQVSDSGQLGASGAGTIETSGTFTDWPATGFCRITTAADSLREIVYYSSRTNTVLTVPAAGRGLLDSIAAAGAADDKLDAVPGVKIAAEAPSSDHFSMPENEYDTDEVSGLSWSTGITAAGGLDVGSLVAGEMVGIWFQMEVVEGRTASPLMEDILEWSFDISAKSLSNKSAGQYRIADDTLERYELFRGVDEEPDLDGEPYETFTTLPHITDAEPDAKTFFVLRRRNEFNLSCLNIQSWSVKLDADSNVVLPDPAGPQNVNIAPAAGATGYVTAQYLYGDSDEDAATHWLVYFTDDGADPDPDVDEPVVVTMSKRNGMANLKWTSSAADNEDTLKVIVRTRVVSGEESADSTNTDIHSCTASDEGPDEPTGRAFLGHAAEVM